MGSGSNKTSNEFVRIYKDAAFCGPVEGGMKRFRMVVLSLFYLVLLTGGMTGRLWSEEAEKASYGERIRRYTTEPFFMTDWILPIPEGKGVPSPLDVLGYIPGAEGKLTDVATIHKYFRTLAAASPRVKVFSLGRSEEGREIILAAIADESTMARLDHYRAITRRLADPRGLSEEEAEQLIREGKPIYWLTGGLHSPETGSPEMLMELAYRLAVSDDPRIQRIRKNVIVLITPVQEVDGRDRIVELYRYHENHPDKPYPSLIYWGHYVAHDNNRDNIGLALALTRHMLAAHETWHPQVQHDLHESVPFLYIMGGTGPFNAWLDPTVVDEWREMAWQEVTALTRQGVPGVWTHGFWDGWAPNYMVFITMGRNGMGRFYETFGNSVPDTMERTLSFQTRREWYRLNPPLKHVRWSLRNNVNVMESGVLEALQFTARHRDEFLRSYYQRALRAVRKPELEGPAAWVLPADENHHDLQRRLLRLLLKQRIEIHRLKKTWKSGKTTVPAGSYVIRMDQPYARLADMLLDRQYYNPKDPRPYDDTGWTLGEMFRVRTERITDRAILDQPMERVTEVPPVLAQRGKGNILLIRPTGEPANFLLPFRLDGVVPLSVATEAFRVGKTDYPAGTWIVELTGPRVATALDRLKKLDLVVTRVRSLPEVKRQPVRAPRIALVHSWVRTQDEGWYRIALDTLGVPYDYISVQRIPEIADLRATFDVLILAPNIGSPHQLVNGLPGREPIPWMTTPETPSIGRIDATPDIRPGMGLKGVMKIKEFLEKGGTLIAIGSSAQFPVTYGLVDFVRVDSPRRARVSGTLLKAEFLDKRSPIRYGYDDVTTVYYNGGVILNVGLSLGRFFMGRPDFGHRPSGRGGPKDRDVVVGRPPEKPVPPPKPKPWEEGFFVPDPFFRSFLQNLIPPIEKRPRIIAKFTRKANELLVSGLLDHGEELAGKPILVDVPVGQGHVVLYAFNPVWRNYSEGMYGLFFNAIIHHTRLSLGWPPPEALKPAKAKKPKSRF